MSASRQKSNKINEQLSEPTPREVFENWAKFADFEKLHVAFGDFDKFYQANLAKLTGGISPASLQSDFFSWMAQLGQSPGHLMELATYPFTRAHDYMNNILSIDKSVKEGTDVRFHKEEWQGMPWRLWAESFLELENWMSLATKDVSGLSEHSERSVSFFVRQMLDALSPSNFVLTNPELFQETVRSGGYNLVRGTELAVEHMFRRFTGAPPPGADNFIPGKDVAITPGRIVFKNRLIELIQYEPQTKTVYKEPILIIPAWIMKYYILDLSPHNSLVNWLVSKGHTVFMISWHNPDEEDRNLGMDDYYRLGAMAAIDKISEICSHEKINLFGYCIGGTLAMITAAAMSRAHDDRLNSLTLLAAQGDFTDAGELMLFITKSQVDFLENMMWEQGYLEPKQMAGAFQLLRSYDLLWSKMVQDYMHGRERGMIDLLAWNADATRMPYRMHTEYLEKLFLNNEFAKGRFVVEGHHIAPRNIHLETFVVSTENDHVAPWKSVYKIHLMLNETITFILTSGGHNAGIVSEPGHKGRYYYTHTKSRGEAYLSPGHWLDCAKKEEGSWWPELHHWLVEHSTSKKRITPPALSHSLPKAPGEYILQK